MPERHEEGARWAHALRYLAQQLDGDRGDALAFQFGCDQTHGLVAEGSHGDQQRHVDTVGDQMLRHLRCGAPD